MDTGVLEFVHILRDDGKPTGGRGAREHGVRQMVVWGLTLPSLGFHDESAGPRVGQGPIQDSVFEEVVQDALESLSEIVSAPSGI